MKSFFTPAVEPVGAIWLFMAVGTLCLLWRKQWRNALWLGLPTTLIFLAGSTRFTEWIVARAEQNWAAQARWSDPGSRWSQADAVVVLGGGFYASEHDPYGFALSHAGGRLLAGLELARLARPKALVLGGGAALADRTEGSTPVLAQRWLELWRPPSVTVTNLGICADTHDEAVRFRELSRTGGWRKVILVTSALHMSRSAAVFRKQGVEVEPAPCDFQALGVRARFPGISPFPRAERLLMLAQYVHELVGGAVYRWRGWV